MSGTWVSSSVGCSLGSVGRWGRKEVKLQLAVSKLTVWMISTSEALEGRNGERCLLQSWEEFGG